MIAGTTLINMLFPLDKSVMGRNTESMSEIRVDKRKNSGAKSFNLKAENSIKKAPQLNL